MATPKACLRERETRIIILLTYIGSIAECACFSTIMYWSAHVGTQENGYKMNGRIYLSIDSSQLPLSENKQLNVYFRLYAG